MADTKIYSLSDRSNVQSLVRQYTILKAKQHAITIDESEPPKYALTRLQLVSSFLQRDLNIVHELLRKLAAASEKWMKAIDRLPDEDQQKASKQFKAFQAENSCLDVQHVNGPARSAKLTSSIGLCDKLIDELTRTIAGPTQPSVQPAARQSSHDQPEIREAECHHDGQSSNAASGHKERQPPKQLEERSSCAFCSHPGHRSTHCLNYSSFEKRLLRAARHSICLACCSLRPRPHLWKACPHEPVKCAFCKLPGHHQAFCRSWLKIFPNRINRSRPQTNARKNPIRDRFTSSRDKPLSAEPNTSDADNERNSSGEDANTTALQKTPIAYPATNTGRPNKASQAANPQVQISSSVKSTAQSASAASSSSASGFRTSRPPTDNRKKPTHGRSKQSRTVAAAATAKTRSDAATPDLVGAPGQGTVNRPCRLLRCICICHRDDCEYIIPLPWKTTDPAKDPKVTMLTPSLQSLGIGLNHLHTMHSTASNPRPERPPPEPSLQPIRRGWSVARGGACNSPRRPPTQDRFKAMMASFVTSADTTMWHTCSGPLRVGADGKPFIPSTAYVADSSGANQECHACRQSRPRQASNGLQQLLRLHRGHRTPTTGRNNLSRGRSPQPQCSHTTSANDAVAAPIGTDSDYELSPNTPLDEWEQRALEASLSELYTNARYSSRQRSRSPSPPGEFGPYNGLAEEEFDAPPAAQENIGPNEQVSTATFARFGIHHARFQSDHTPEAPRDAGTLALPTFRGGLYDDDLYENDFHAGGSLEYHRYEDDFEDDDFHEDDSVRWS